MNLAEGRQDCGRRVALSQEGDVVDLEYWQMVDVVVNIIVVVVIKTAQVAILLCLGLCDHTSYGDIFSMMEYFETTATVSTTPEYLTVLLRREPSH